LATRNLVIDCKLFSKLILQIIERSKGNIYLIVKVWNYFFIITGKFPFRYCNVMNGGGGGCIPPYHHCNDYGVVTHTAAAFVMNACMGGRIRPKPLFCSAPWI
jgi:hypothetical protein